MSSELALKAQRTYGGKWKQYPAYRDSGVEWLGEVPEHWINTVLKRVCKNITDGSHFSPEIQYVGIPYVTVQDIKDDYIDFDNCKRISEKDYLSLKKNGCQPNRGDVLLTKDGTIGKAIVIKENRDFVILSSLGMITPNQLRISSEYMRYYLISGLNIDQMFSFIRGSALTRLTIKLIKDLIMVIPPPSEQKSIVTYIDDKTERIDTLIEKKERQVELLQEKRAALISQVVTKGLDPDVKMKDSGVEWLGEVPEHWEVTPLRGVLKQRGEYNIGPRTTNILSVVKDVGVINYDERVASGNKKSDNVEQYKIIHKGDIVVNRMNVIIGSVGVANEFGAASIEYYVLYAKDNSVYTEYYGQIFRSKMFQKNLGRLGSGILGHRLRIPFEVLKSEMLPKPPYSEQHNIANALNDERKRIDNLTTKVRESISKLSEYRTALISAAVTGKIDVRQEAA